MTSITIDLPDDLAREVEGAGLLAPKAIEDLVRAELRSRHLREFLRVADELAAKKLPRMSMDEIQAEVNTVRRSRRDRAARS